MLWPSIFHVCTMLGQCTQTENPWGIAEANSYKLNALPDAQPTAS